MIDFMTLTPTNNGTTKSYTTIVDRPLTGYIDWFLLEIPLDLDNSSGILTNNLIFTLTSSGIEDVPHSTYLEPTLLLPQEQLQGTLPVSNKALAAIEFALGKVGRPYRYGAKGQNDTFDCSGLVYAAYKHAGMEVPGSSAGWLSSGKKTVDKMQGQPGDVIVTSSANSPSGKHVRLITRNLGNGKYECVEAKGKKYGVVKSTYTVDKYLKNIYRAKTGIKLIKNPRYGKFK